jgi:hypothetical protein
MKYRSLHTILKYRFNIPNLIFHVQNIGISYRNWYVKTVFKSEIFEIFCNSVEGRKNFFKHYFFSIDHQRPTNGEYIAGENEFFGRLWSPGEPSEDMPIKHRENTFMSIKIDRVIRFCSTFLFKVWY